jgi:DNA-binding transcriptional LysR family regulator
MTFDTRSAGLIVACARHGSLGRAAAALGVTQPALSRLLRRVEDDLGAPLFERTTRGLVPTVYGAAVLPYAELVLAEIAKAREVLAELKGASRGLVRVGGVASVAGSLIVAAIREVRRAAPDVQFQIVEGLEDALLDDLVRGEVDLVVSPSVWADEVVALAMPETLSDEVAVYARAGHPALAGPPPGLAEVAGMAWALPPADTPVVREWAARFLTAGLTPRPAVVVSRSVQVIRAAVLADDLLCWSPRPLFAADEAAGLVARLAIPALDWRRTFRVYRRRKSLVTPATALLLAAIRQQGAA